MDGGSDGSAVDQERGRPVLVALQDAAFAEALSRLLAASGVAARHVPLSQPHEPPHANMLPVLLVDADANIDTITAFVGSVQRTRRETRVVLLTRHEPADRQTLAARIGAWAIASRGDDLEALAALLGGRRGEVARNAQYPSGRHRVNSSRGQRSRPRLTRRERDTLEVLAHGLNNADIAQLLGISPNTVRSHLQNVFMKLGARNRLEAVTVARRMGVLNGVSPSTTGLRHG
jgi:DNA-binding NarL/FixJ family response regulator